MSFASESGHWYTHTGTPAYEVEKAKGGLRPATLRDARKLGLYPSVTGIIREAAQPGLVWWQCDNMAEAAVRVERLVDESRETWLGRVRLEANVLAELARERGTQIHAAIENGFEGLPMGELTSFAIPVMEWVFTEFPEWEVFPERSFAHKLGYGGKIDLALKGKRGWAIIDFKTTDKDLETVKGYESHIMQLAACASGVGADFEETQFINLFVSSVTPGNIRPLVWKTEEADNAWEMFQCLLRYWKFKRNYFPGESHGRL